MLDLGRTILAAAERDPRAQAITDGDLSLDYGDWYPRIEQLADGLRRLGIARGDMIVSALQNTWQAATLHWACQLSGVIIVPLNWRMKAEEIDYCLQDAAAKALFWQDESADAAKAASAATRIPGISINDPTNGFDALLSSGVSGTGPQAGADDLSVMLYTSGTTGRPKGVPRRHAAERAAAVAHVAQNIYVPGERTLGVMPLYHTMGVRSLLSMALVNGLFAAQPKFEAGQSLDLIQGQRLTSLYLVPTLFHELLARPSFAPRQVQTCRKLGYAGAPMSDGLLKRVREGFKPERMVNHYGSSEIYTFTIDPDAFAKPGSAGKAGINQRVRVVQIGARDPDATMPIDEEGEIIAERISDESFDGYWNRPDADAKALIGDWYFTGDTGRFDADGDLFVTGRVDDMMITGGENVTPVEVENVISLHPDVSEVVVAGLPDERWGQQVTAFVVGTSEDLDADTLDAFCRESDLANFKRPRGWVFVRSIPKSPTGKVLRRLLIAGDYERR